LRWSAVDCGVVVEALVLVLRRRLRSILYFYINPAFGYTYPFSSLPTSPSYKRTKAKKRKRVKRVRGT